MASWQWVGAKAVAGEGSKYQASAPFLSKQRAFDQRCDCGIHHYGQWSGRDVFYVGRYLQFTVLFPANWPRLP